MALMEKPPQPESAEKRVREKLESNGDYGKNESLLVLDILQSEAKFKFGKPIEKLSFAEKADLTAPETITRTKRSMYSMRESDHEKSQRELENKILLKVQEDDKYANSDTVLTLDLWIDEAQRRWDKELSELAKEQKKRLTRPEQFSSVRRRLTNQGFISPDGEVQEGRMEKSERFRDYFREV